MSKLAWVMVSLLWFITAAACTPVSDGGSQATYNVDPAFADFYRQFGGSSTLGPAISPAFSDQGLTYQYVVSGLMVYDPGQVALQRFYFSPLASEQWHINGPVEPVPEAGGTPYVNGHQIWEEVASFYQQYGPDLIGLPLAGVAANDAKQRYEQYFQGLGFYRNYTDSPGQIHLMPYGIWMCGKECPYQVSDSIPPTPSYARDYSETEQLFLQAAERFGYGYSGAPLSAPRLGSDGLYEMIFENVALYIDPSSGDQVKLRPLPAWLGIQTEPPQAEKKAYGVSFYPLSENLGFDVPNIFLDYLDRHRGVVYSGPPAAEYRTLADGGYSQCFTNLCLEYHPSAPQALRIRPHSLGVEYQSMGENVSASGTSIPQALQIHAWEDFPLIPSGERQGIHIEATQNSLPVPGLKFSLVVTQPNGITKTYSLDPTGVDGRTSVELDPVNGPNGAIVQYEICVLGEASPQICFSRSYTIWAQ